MYSHVLVPLDGSKLAEQVLPHVRALAQHDPGLQITLLLSVSPHNHAIPAPDGGMFDHFFDAQAEIVAARRYLRALADELQTEGIGVMLEVSKQPAAEAILSYVRKHGIDLIAIATHGRGGISRWVFGSVTQKVIEAARMPVLVIRPKAAA
jgi:nucleotide-binding universal stress UspA family protein